MESHKSEKGAVVSQNDYTQSCQIRNRNCYGCGELGQFARNWPTKRRTNGLRFKPKNQQKCNWGQRPLTGKIRSKIYRNVFLQGLQVLLKIISHQCHISASDSSEGYFSSALDSSEHYSSSNFSDSLIDNHFSAHGNRSEKYLSNFYCQIPIEKFLLSISEKTWDGSLQIPIDTGVDSLPECHRAVQTLHNLLVSLVINSPVSDNLNEFDLQILQSVICNLSQCLQKSTGVSKSTDVAAFMPDKQLVAANSGKTEKGRYAPEEEEDQSHMANIEVELNSIKSEIRCLRVELEIEGVKKAHAGTHENGATRTLANRNDVNNGSCPEVNLVMMENNFGYTCAPFSQERSHWLPYLNLDPMMDDELFISHIKKYEDAFISQNNFSEEPVQKSNFNTTAHNPGQPSAKTETKKNEDHFRVLQESKSCSDSCIEYMRDYNGNNSVEVTEYPSSIRIPLDIHDLENVDEYPTSIRIPLDIHDFENVDAGHVLEENLCLESDSTWEEINLNEEDII